MRYARSQQQNERSGLMRDMLAKEALMSEKFAREKTKLQEQMEVVEQQLQEANQRWETRPSLPKDEEHIKSL